MGGRVDFTYRAMDPNGTEIYGEIRGSDRADAERRLRAEGLDPLEITPADELARPGERSAGFTETTSDRGQGFASGCLSGWALGLVLIVLGLLLTFTWIGAVIGIPMIIIGIIVPFVVPFFGLRAVRGPCPYCGSEVRSGRTDPLVRCRTCGRVIVVRDGRYYRAQ
ncbi:MAG: hypothetical protein GF405_03185 [Candidatus Eisenbacteria bacterium]|nr:hypothetical protein [Candidatus Eisenbacteria bacterium]